MRDWTIKLGLFLGILLLFSSCLTSEKKSYDFTLRGPQGDVSLSRFKGKLVLLYFGFLNCPDACPTTLSKIGAVLRLLPLEKEKRVEVLFIGLDPERDTLAKMKEYTEYFHPKIIPLRGEIENLKNIMKRYGGTFQKVKIESEMNYTIDHTTELLVVKYDGSLVSSIEANATAEDMLKIIADNLK